MVRIFMAFYLSNKEPLGNHCARPLPVLYYKGSGLNGMRFPSGMEIIMPRTLRGNDRGLNGMRFPSGMEILVVPAKAEQVHEV